MLANKKAYFRFYAELNDFLPQGKRFKTFPYPFFGKPSVKDAIEAVGVPHPEVDLILVNGRSVDFFYHINDNDFISVYPQFELLDISPITHLRPKPLRTTKFILDINLGRLARKLRLLGFDSLYSNAYNDLAIIKLALKEQRIILTRDIGLLKDGRVTHGYWVRSAIADEQIGEIVEKFDLYTQINPFHICLNCNGQLKHVPKDSIAGSLLPETKKIFNDFMICKNCGRIYWKGSHYQRMVKFVNRFGKRPAVPPKRDV